MQREVLCGSLWPEVVPRLNLAQLCDAALSEVFERRCGESPGQTACHSDTGELTYKELNSRANQIARSILEGGDEAENVAVLAPAGPDAFAALIGIWKAGKCAVPIQPDGARDKIRDCIGQAGARTVILGDAERECVPDGCTVIALGSLERDGETENPALVIDPGQAAILLYTSGSRGVPKGVVIPHRALLHIAQINISSHAYGYRDRHLHGFSMQSLAGLSVIMQAVLSGGTIYCLDVNRAGVHAIP
jgi:iturin family lipopeptide synthetase A